MSMARSGIDPFNRISWFWLHHPTEVSFEVTFAVDFSRPTSIPTAVTEQLNGGVILISCP